MKYETKNSFGKRMVRESKIKEIGQGGGTTYTAGDNITIEDGVISATNTIYGGGYGIYKDDADESYYFTGNETNTIALTENGVGIDFSVNLKSGGGINADNDGLYLDTSVAALKSDLTDIPNCEETTDGTYVLKATVSSGVVTYAWVLEV